MRDIGARGIDPTLTDLDEVDYAWFVSIDLPSGIVRYTTRDGDVTANVDGTSQTWSSYDVVVGAISQGQTTAMDVSYIELQALDAFWAAELLNTGLRNRTVKIYMGWFELQTDGEGVETSVFQGALPMFDGKTDEAEMTTRLKLSLIPHATPWASMVPAAHYSPICSYQYKDPETCQATSTDLACETHSLRECRAKNNEANFGGFPMMPQPNAKLYWGGRYLNLPALKPPGPLPPRIVPETVNRERAATRVIHRTTTPRTVRGG